jgi:AcrR family transcriptional regulator
MPQTRQKRRTTYHHGNLREALVDAAFQLLEEGGPENVSVREAAKRLGVSVGAPFRHFPNRTALMTAVAERTMTQYCAEITANLKNAPENDPLGRLLAVGTAYLRWAIRNPTHFQIISNRSLIDWDNSDSLRRDNNEVRQLMEVSMAEAQQQGILRSHDITLTQIASRALVYGLARMLIDGHFAQWSVTGHKPEATMQMTLELFVSLLSREKVAEVTLK